MNVHKRKQGFTIIEVVLVLAIAGLIFIMIFITLPALQRAQRDQQRKSDAATARAKIIQWKANNKNASLSRANDSGGYSRWFRVTPGNALSSYFGAKNKDSKYEYSEMSPLIRTIMVAPYEANNINYNLYFKENVDDIMFIAEGLTCSGLTPEITNDWLGEDEFGNPVMSGNTYNLKYSGPLDQTKTIVVVTLENSPYYCLDS